MADIHPTAIVDGQAKLAADVSIGAFCIIKGAVTLGAGTHVYEHSHIHGNASIGRNCRIGPAAYLGLAPQHLKFDGKDAWLFIGDNVIIREMASAHRSIHAGPEHGTRIGDRCMLMTASHVGHDCVIGDDVILANAALLGGHCTIGEKAFIGGGATIHQFVRIGRLSIIAGNEGLSHDAPPFSAVRYRGLKGYNAIGCRRAGISQANIHAIRRAFHCLHSHRTVPRALAAIRRNVAMVPEVAELVAFYSSTRRGVLHSTSMRASVAAAMIDSAPATSGDDKNSID